MSRGVCGLIAALAVSLVCAASASANTYCVPTGGAAGCFNSGALDLQTALNDAAANLGADIVKVASGQFVPSNCSVSGFTYNSPDALTIVGAGFPTELTCPDDYNAASFNYILDLHGPVTLSDLDVQIPKGINGRGVSLAAGASASDLTVTSDLQAANVIGVKMSGGSVQHSLIGTPLADNLSAVFATDGASLDDVSVNGGGTGVNAEGPQDVTILHSKISARRGVLTDFGGVSVADTMIDVLPGSGNGVAGGLLTNNTSGAVPLSITARNVSIAGTAPGSIGVDVEALVAGQTASATITDTVIHGPPTALKRSAVAGATANLTTSYDAYAAGNYAGTGTGTTTESTPPVTADPGFAASADPHIAAGSPLIDAGSPGGLSPGEPTVDLDGNPRILDGNHDCAARRDIGAYEFDDPTPTAKASASASRVAPGTRVGFHGVGCSNDPSVAVTLTWAFDDGASGTGADVSHAFAHAGTHHATLTVRDAGGHTNTSTATVTVVAPTPPSPVLSKLTVKPARFHVTKHRHKHFKLGTTIRYRDSLAATTTFTVTQRAKGIRKGKRCVAPPRNPKRHGKKPRKCTRTVSLGTFTHRDKAGPNTVSWNGKLKRRALKAGSYTLQAIASAAGRKSRAVTTRFTVLA